jgi:hypothetical protein
MTNDKTLTIILDDGSEQTFTIYFTYEFKEHNFVVYFHESDPDALYVKRYDADNKLYPLTEAERSFADKIVEEYEEAENENE